MSDDDRDRVHAQWQEVARSEGTLSVLDVARRVSEAAGTVHALVRALCVEDVYLSVEDGDRIPTSVRDGQSFVHVHSSPARAVGGLDVEDERFDVRPVRLPAWLATLPPGTGVRLDPDTDVEVVLDATRVRLLLATAAGVPTPSALTPALEERLFHLRGPEEVTDLDRAVRAEVSGRLRRCLVRLDGIGGRDWPTYLVDGDGREPREVAGAVERAAGVPVAVLVEGQPGWLAALLGPADEVALEIPADLG